MSCTPSPWSWYNTAAQWQRRTSRPGPRPRVASCWSYSSDCCRRLPRSAISRDLCVASFKAKPHTDATATAMHSTTPPLTAAVIAVVNALVLQCGRGREVRRRHTISGYVAAAPGRRRAVVPVVLPGRDVTVCLIVHGCVLVQGPSPGSKRPSRHPRPASHAGAVPFFSAKAKHTAVSSPLLLLFSQQAGAVDATSRGGPHRPRLFPSSATA